MAQPSSTTHRKPKPPNYDPYVRHAVSVETGPEQAFEVFLREFPAWWPHNFRCTKVGAPLGVDAAEGGRWYEIDTDGHEHTFGRLLVVTPPERLVIAWHLNGFGRIDPDNASEFEVRFTSEGATQTRVEVEHTKFDRMGTRHAKRVRNGMDKGWPTILAAYREKVGAPDAG